MRTKNARQRISPALWAMLSTVALMTTGCTMTQPGKPTQSMQDYVMEQLMSWPSLEDTERQLQGAVDEIATAAEGIVPGIRFTDRNGESGTSCGKGFEGTAAQARYLPDRVGEGATVSDAQWAKIEAATRVAAAKVDARTAQLMKNAPGDHDVRFIGPGGSSIKIAYQANLVISGFTGCRLSEADRHR